MPPATVEVREHPFGEQGVRSSLEEVARRAAEGGLRPDVRRWAIEMLDKARKAGDSVNTPVDRARVLLSAVQEKLWVPDPVGTEFIQGAHLTACTDPDSPCFQGGDCFPVGTLLLTDKHELKPIEEVCVGERIWGQDKWSTVEGAKYKGVLSVDVVKLNNGSQLKLTPDHYVYVLVCSKHTESCSCEEREERRVKVSDLREGDVLVAPSRLAFGESSEDPDVSYLEGLYISDGWSDQNSRFCISGQDGCPKEAQKHEVRSICERLGVETRWHRKYIAVNDGDLTLRMQQLGGRAREKHAATLSLGEAQAASLLRGIMADSGKNTRGEGRTFTTTSRQLAVQVRVLHKMFGVTCGWSYIENHGGLGQHPIYRLGTRPSGGWRLRVRSIERDVLSVPCWDIQTDDHRVYLPEHDVTVSNCDDLVVLLGAAFLSVGLDTLVVGHAYDQQKTIGHVLAAVHLNGKWHYADPSPVGSTHQPLGRCVPFTRERLYSLPNASVICDENACLSSGRAFSPDRFVERGTFVGVTGTPEFAYRFQWLERVEPAMRRDPPFLSRPQLLGQPQQVVQTQPGSEQKLSTVEKALLASVIISAASLVIHVWELKHDYRRSQP